MIRTRKNEFLGFGKKKAKTDEVSAKDLKPLLAREVVYGKKAYKLDSVYMKDNTLTIHFETEIYSNKKPVKIETIFTIDFNGNLDDNNLVIYKEQSVYPKGAIHKEYELKPKKEIHNKHYNNLTDAADDCNNIIEKNIESLLKNVVRDGYKLNVGESLRSVCCLKKKECLKPYSACKTLRKTSINSYFNEAHQGYKVFLVDLNGITEFDSLDKALKVAKEMDSDMLDICEKASNDEIKEWLKNGDLGLESGDVELYVITESNIKDSSKVDDFEDLYERNSPSIRIIRNNFKPFKVFSGFEAVEEEAFRRHMLHFQNTMPAYAYTRRDKRKNIFMK